MSKTLNAIVLIACLCFAFGAVAVWFGLIDSNIYIIMTGVLGSLASIIGLMTLGTSKITKNQIINMEADLFEELAKTVKSIKENEEKLSASKEEITKITQERIEIENLVRRAALKAFSEERLYYTEIEIKRRVEADSILLALLDDYNLAKTRLSEISDEIQESGRADLISGIVSDFRKKSHENSEEEIIVHVLGQKIDLAQVFFPVVKLLVVYAEVIKKLVVKSKS